MKPPRQLTQEECKEYILRYKKYDHKEVVPILVAQYDKFIVKFMFSYRKRFIYVREVPLQELYNTAVTAMLGSFKVCPDDIDPKWLPKYIQAYVTASFRSTYSYKTLEHKYKDRRDIDFISRVREYETELYDNASRVDCDKIDVDHLLQMDILSGEEKEVIKHKFLKGMSLRETGETLGIPLWRVRWLVMLSLRKLKDFLIPKEE
jgi:RNA polymerase sigma factor (sigma-70 family)